MEQEIKNLLHNLAFLRKQHGCSAAKMAALLGIGVGSLRQIERGILPPRLSTEDVFKAAKRFGIAPKDLFVRRLE